MSKYSCINVWMVQLVKRCLCALHKSERCRQRKSESGGKTLWKFLYEELCGVYYSWSTPIYNVQKLCNRSPVLGDFPLPFVISIKHVLQILKNFFLNCKWLMDDAYLCCVLLGFLLYLFINNCFVFFPYFKTKCHLNHSNILFLLPLLVSKHVHWLKKTSGVILRTKNQISHQTPASRSWLFSYAMVSTSEETVDRH